MLRAASGFLVLLLLGCPKAASEPTTATDPSDPSGEAADADADVEPEDLGKKVDSPAEPPGPGEERLIADREQSSVGFAVSRATVGHIGHFEHFAATMTLKDGQPIALAIEVKTGSVTTDAPGLATHLLSPEFFDVAAFPTATFTAETFEPVDDASEATHRVAGTLRLHGVERKLDFPATLAIGLDRVAGSAVLEISAKAFGIDYEGMAAELAEDAVELEIELVFPRVVLGAG